MDIELATRRYFQSLPVRPYGQVGMQYRYIVVMPTRKKHESGFNIINLVGCDVNGLCEITSDCADSIRWDVGRDVLMCDCLPRSGLIRYWLKSNRCFHVSVNNCDVEITSV